MLFNAPPIARFEVSYHRGKRDCGGFYFALIGMESQQTTGIPLNRCAPVSGYGRPALAGPCVHFDTANVASVVSFTTKSNGVLLPIDS